tara:strand:- start:1558 stop:2613 length:1056 start_codon:yes stop_codon:yes gene_type:complete
MTELIINKTLEYLKVPAVVGHEKLFMDYLEKDLKALNLTTDKYRRLLAVHGNEPFSAILCAHIDRHGLISLGSEEYVYAAKYIKEMTYNENDQLSEEVHRNIIRRFEGERVFAYDPKTGDKIGEGVIEAYPELVDGQAIFYVQAMMEIADSIPLAYAREAHIEDNWLKGQIDNVISIGAIYQLFKDGFQGTVLFATEEEIGKSWMHIVSYLKKEKIKTQDILVLDTSPFTESKQVEEGHIILRNRDFSEEFSVSLVERLKERCEKLGLVYTFKDEFLLSEGKMTEQLGSTELGRLIQGSKGLWSGASIQIPTLQYHTSSETTTVKAIENYYKFLRNILIEDQLCLSICVKK